MTYFYTTLAILMSAMGDYFAKKYSLTLSICWMLCAFAAYNGGIICWLQMIQRMNSLAQAGKIWVIGATVVMLLISQFLFQEPINAKQWIGIIFWFYFIAVVALTPP